MSLETVFSSVTALNAAQVIYATWGHLENPDNKHTVTFTFGMDFHGNGHLLQYGSLTHEESPGLYNAVLECISKIEDRLCRPKNSLEYIPKPGVYQVTTTYFKGKCFLSKKYLTVSKLLKLN